MKYFYENRERERDKQKNDRKCSKEQKNEEKEI